MTDSVLAALDFSLKDKVIAIRENKLADVTFILASIMSKCISEDKTICLITLHNTFSHYQHIGRRIGFDLLKQIQDNRVKLIEPLNDIAKDFFENGLNQKYYSVDPNIIAKQLFLEVYEKTNQLLEKKKHCFVIIDDLSHLIDLGLDLKGILGFIQHLIGLTSTNENVTLVANCHATSNIEDTVANLLFYYASLQITVSALKTGRSRNVSGILTLNRCSSSNTLENQSIYHYKLLEKEIRTFAPGRAII